MFLLQFISLIIFLFFSFSFFLLFFLFLFLFFSGAQKSVFLAPIASRFLLAFQKMFQAVSGPPVRPLFLFVIFACFSFLFLNFCRF